MINRNNLLRQDHSYPLKHSSKDLFITYISPLKMARSLFILFSLCLFIYCGNLHAQSYLGKNKKEIYQLVQARSAEALLTYHPAPDGPDLAFVEVSFLYEKLYYYLEDGVCVKFEVIKPYSCNCLETDIEAYQQACIAVGDLQWINKEYTNLFKMSLYENEYKLSITPINQPKTSKLLSSDTK